MRNYHNVSVASQSISRFKGLSTNSKILKRLMVGGVLLALLSTISCSKGKDFNSDEALLEKLKNLELSFEHRRVELKCKLEEGSCDIFVLEDDSTVKQVSEAEWEKVWNDPELQEAKKLIPFHHMVSQYDIALGDLNSDGTKDAVFLVNFHTRGTTGFFKSLWVAINKNGSFEAWEAQALGDRVSVENLLIQDGKIIIRGKDHCPCEGLATASLDVEVHYILSGNKLRELERKEESSSCTPCEEG